MVIYHFNSVTGEFVGTSVAKRSPLEPGKFLIPKFAVNIEPPASGPKQKARWNGTSWELLADFRGDIVWNKETKEPMKVDELGDIPQEYTTKPPIEDAIWNGIEWEVSLSVRKQKKLKALENKRIDVAESGILVNGSFVPSDKAAVILLLASQNYLKDKPNKKIKRTGLGELNSNQITSLIEAIGQQYDAAFAREADLYAAIQAASTVEELEAIDIDSGW